MDPRHSLNRLISRLESNRYVGRFFRILTAIWRSGDLPQKTITQAAVGSRPAAIDTDYDAALKGIEECLVRHENALRELEALVRGRLPDKAP